MPPRHMPRRWPLLSLCLGLLAACADPATAPPLAVEAGARLEQGTTDSVFFPNSRRYRDSGRPPSTGRAGNAALQLLSLVGPDGRADIHVRAEMGTYWWPSEPRLESVQLKGFAPDGTHLFTRNETAIDTVERALQASGLAPGSRVQVQAVIAGADPRRAGVVTVDDMVRRLPDVALADVTIPIRAAMYTAPTLRAVVRELNGDFGGSADCVLDVDGIEVDRVHEMWVDAGGTVTCQFFHVFRALGEHVVRVRLEPRFLRDWNPDNNAAERTIRIDPIPSSFHFDAYFRDDVFDEYGRWSYRTVSLDGTLGYEQANEYSSTGRVQDAWMSAHMPQPVRFPIERLQVRQSTRGGTVQGFTLINVAADYSWSDGVMTESCVRRTFIPEIGGRGWLDLCSVEVLETEWNPPAAFTHASYYRNAGDVTYHSRESWRMWDHGLGYEQGWSWNYDATDTYGRFATYGLEYGFFLAVLSEGVLHRVNPIVWLAPEEWEQSSPWQCFSWADDWFRTESCGEHRSSHRGVLGAVYGEPWTP